MHAAKPAAVFGHARWGWNAQYVLPYRIQRLQPDTCSNTKKKQWPFSLRFANFAKTPLR